ncbi:TlyA family RNA methyltransferase [bacterium]|nr:TlyA family RNA methyltransferase [bacterium]
MTRIDQLLNLKNLAPSRTKAKELIDLGVVEAFLDGNWVCVKSPSQRFDPETSLRVIDRGRLKYVSRAGLKLEGALEHFQISVQNKSVLDIGQSTGGFTDCVLQHGAAEVLGIDVGHGQLHEKIRSDHRVRFYEGLHIKDLNQNEDILIWWKSHLDFIVIDVSFISLVKVFEVLKELPKRSLNVLALVKPQFEVGKSHLSKSGLVKDQKVLKKTLDQIREILSEMGFESSDYYASSLLGGDGNQEFFLFAKFSNK